MAAPLPATGCAAPRFVPGAMAATSAAIVRTKPADAARAPDGATKTATGVEARRSRATIVRVDSRRPPGVFNVNTSSAAWSRSARSIAPIMYWADTGWMRPSMSAVTTTGSPCSTVVREVATASRPAQNARRCSTGGTAMRLSFNGACSPKMRYAQTFPTAFDADATWRTSYSSGPRSGLVQGEALAYLIEENRLLRKQVGGRRLRFTDDDRRSAERWYRTGFDARCVVQLHGSS